jgi:hypothetical protein
MDFKLSPPSSPLLTFPTSKAHVNDKERTISIFHEHGILNIEYDKHKVANTEFTWSVYQDQLASGVTAKLSIEGQVAREQAKKCVYKYRKNPKRIEDKVGNLPNFRGF